MGPIKKNKMQIDEKEILIDWI